MSTELQNHINTQVLDTDATQPLSTEYTDDPAHSQTQPGTEQQARTSDNSRVWNAQALPDDEPPARGVRLGQLAWGLIVVLCGLFLIALAFVPSSSFPLVLIGLVAMLGLTLIVIATVISLAHPRRTRTNRQATAN